MPIVNNLTAAGAVVGFVLGFIGIWRSRALMSGFGVFLCGAAVVLTVVAQTELGEKLDQIGTELDSLDTTETTAAAAQPAVADPAGYAPAPGDFSLEVITLEEKCFGSAGCKRHLPRHRHLPRRATTRPDKDIHGRLRRPRRLRTTDRPLHDHRLTGLGTERTDDPDRLTNRSTDRHSHNNTLNGPDKGSPA